MLALLHTLMMSLLCIAPLLLRPLKITQTAPLLFPRSIRCCAVCAHNTSLSYQNLSIEVAYSLPFPPPPYEAKCFFRRNSTYLTCLLPVIYYYSILFSQASPE